MTDAYDYVRERREAENEDERRYGSRVFIAGSYHDEDDVPARSDVATDDPR